MTKEKKSQIFGNTTVGYWMNDDQGVYSWIHPDRDVWSLLILFF